MTRTHLNPPRRQTGSATLIISLMLLFTITLVTLYTTRSAIMEQSISANQVRSDQALASADAGLNALIAWYNSGHWTATANKPTSGSPWTATDFALTNNLGYTFKVFFCRDTAVDNPANPVTSCPAPSGKKKAAMVAIGVSDDGTAQRTLVRKVGTVGVVKEGGAGASISTRASSSLQGNMTAINRYFNTTVWSGGDITGNMGSVQTFILDPAINRDHLTHAQLTEAATNSGTANYAIEASNKAQGSGSGIKADIIENDPNLRNLTGDQFFESFFSADKAFMKAKAQAEGQYFTSVPANLASLTGLVWIEGNVSVGAAGTLDNPIFLVVEGNCTVGGNDTLTGLLYVTGTWTGHGNYNVVGAAGVEGTINLTGNPQVIYDPEALGGNEDPSGGGGVAGSWRDFGG